MNTMKLGNTTYTIEDSSSGNVKLARTNPNDKPAQFFVPRRLLIGFLAPAFAQLEYERSMARFARVR